MPAPLQRSTLALTQHQTQPAVACSNCWEEGLGWAVHGEPRGSKAEAHGDGDAGIQGKPLGIQEMI